MHAADCLGTPGILLGDENRGEKGPDVGKSKFETFLESGANGAATHLIQRVAVPLAVHIGFPETERPGSKDSAKEPRVMHLYVPEARAVDANIRELEQIGHHILGSGHIIAGSALVPV
jgi:hypothetical protein